MNFLPFWGPPIKITAFNILNKWRFFSTVRQLPSVCLPNSSTNTSVIRVVDVTVTHVTSWHQRRKASDKLRELLYICGLLCTWDHVCVKYIFLVFKLKKFKIMIYILISTCTFGDLGNLAQLTKLDLLISVRFFYSSSFLKLVSMKNNTTQSWVYILGISIVLS